MAKGSTASAKRPMPWAWIAVAAALLLVAVVRIRLAGVPLERDEGEYAYAGQLILDGVPPYALAYNMKFPGTYYAYAALMVVLGRTPTGIHLGLLLVNAATILLIFATGRRLGGELAGATAAIAFAVLSLDRAVFGVFAHATHFVVLAVMAGAWLLLRAVDDDRPKLFLLSGACFGIAVLMKQHAVFFAVMALVLAAILRRESRSRNLALLAGGIAIPLVSLAVVLAAQGVFSRFVFWTIRYAAAYVAEVSPSQGWTEFTTSAGHVLSVNFGFWILAAGGFIVLLRKSGSRIAAIAITGLLLAGALAICPGFYFREHYFVLLLPAIALSAGIALAALHRSAPAVALPVLWLVILIFVVRERAYLFSMSPQELSRTTYGANPFPEAVEIGRYVREHTTTDDRIAVLGSEPEIYFYADRKAATGHIYTYALMESQPFATSMQAEMIREVQDAHPAYLVFVRVFTSWLARPGSDQHIVEWTQQYIEQCYDLVGVADIPSASDRKLYWDDEAVRHELQSENAVLTYRKKSDAPCVVGN